MSAKINRRHFIAAGTAAVASPFLARGASAQTAWPSRNVRMVCSYPAGGKTDLLARAFQHEMDHLDGVVFIDRLRGIKRDMIVRNATPPGASGKVFGFVYSGLDVGSFLAPPVFGFLMTAGTPGIIFWIAVSLYLVNAALVMVIRQTIVPTVVPAAPAAAE